MTDIEKTKLTAISDSPSPAGQLDEDSIMLLFSGGLDSTIEAVGRLEKYRRVHLVTFNNGMCWNCRSAARRAAELQAKFGADRVHHQLIQTGPLLRKLLTNWRELWRAFRSPLLVDLACKMAAVTEAVSLAKRQGVHNLSDGSSLAQNEIFIQRPEFAQHFRPWLESLGLRLVEPKSFAVPRREKVQMLRDMQLSTGWKPLEKIYISSQKMHQPFCWWAFVCFWFTGPFRNLSVVKHFELPLERANEAWDVLLPRAEAYLRENLAPPAIIKP